MKKLRIAVLLAGSFGGAATAVNAQTIIVHEAPPAPRNEAVPAARHGYVWAPGHYEYRNHHYVWVRGGWERARRGHDRDGDGVPNRFDAHPNNPNRS